MKMGYRKPSIKRSISARTTGAVKRSVKRSINPTYGKSGMGYINDPKKAIYNKVYNQTTSSVFIGSSSSYSSGDLYSLTVVRLKEILRANGLKVSGTKQELINRILTETSTTQDHTNYSTVNYDESSSSDIGDIGMGCGFILMLVALLIFLLMLLSLCTHL